MNGTIEAHKERAATVWSAGERRYEEGQPGHRRRDRARTLTTSLDPYRRDEFREDFTAFHAAYHTELGICVPRGYWLTVGVRT
jgi:hypothetical protein